MASIIHLTPWVWKTSHHVRSLNLLHGGCFPEPANAEGYQSVLSRILTCYHNQMEHSTSILIVFLTIAVSSDTHCASFGDYAIGYPPDPQIIAERAWNSL